jgi:hypothetical protein
VGRSEEGKGAQGTRRGIGEGRTVVWQMSQHTSKPLQGLYCIKREAVMQQLGSRIVPTLYTQPDQQMYGRSASVLTGAHPCASPPGPRLTPHLLTQLPEAVLHELHLLLPLLAAQAAHHNALAGGDLLVTRVHQVGQGLKRVAGSQASVPAGCVRGQIVITYEVTIMTAH